MKSAKEKIELLRRLERKKISVRACPLRSFTGKKKRKITGLPPIAESGEKRGLSSAAIRPKKNSGG